MAFADISPEQEFIVTRNSDVINTSDYAEFYRTHYNVALNEMQIDLELALRLVHNDTDSLDAIADSFGDVLNNALAYKMLEHYYTRFHDGDGRNAERYKLYKAEYDKLKRTFAQMQSRETLSNNFSIPIRRG
jgi:hypothetical protein